MAKLKTFIGLDPGKKGGYAAIDSQGVQLVCGEMPITPSGEIDSQKLFEALSFTRDATVKPYAVIEKAHAMPKQGVTSTFNYGTGYGKVQAVFELLEIPREYILPQKWKKVFSLLKKEKKDSVKAAQNLFPTVELCTERKRMKDGLAEALLMAEFARRTFLGTVAGK